MIEHDASGEWRQLLLQEIKDFVIEKRRVSEMSRSKLISAVGEAVEMLF